MLYIIKIVRIDVFKLPLLTKNLMIQILVSLHTLRQMAVKAMLSNFNSDIYNDNLRKPIEDILELVRNTKETLPYNEIWENMFMTLNNEVLPGVTTHQTYAKWGRHYLRSLALNLRREIRTNFRDSWMQDFILDMNGETGRFEAESNRAESIFATTLPPPPSLLNLHDLNNPNNILRNKNFRISLPPATNTINLFPTPLPAEYMRGGGCFTANCVVDRWNGTKFELITLDLVRPHDELRTYNGIAEVRCVVKTLCEGNKAELVTFNNPDFTVTPLRITPWHPITIGDEWVYPATISKSSVQFCSCVYNFVLHNEHALMISGFNCVTLGHGFKGPVVEHEYWGNEVIKDLQKKNGWDSGYVVLQIPLSPPLHVQPI